MQENEETIDHMFVHCKFSLKIWARILLELGVVWLTPQSSLDLFGSGLGLCFLNKKGRILWKTASLASCWAIWLKRNYGTS